MKKLLLFMCLAGACLGFSQTVTTTLTYLVKEPAKKSAKTPVLVILHGYGSNESDLFDLSKTLDDRFLVFSLRAPYSSGNGFAWYTLEFLADQQFRYDYKEARESRAKVLSFISHACSAYGVDSSQVYLMGFSQGAILSYDIALAAPKKIRGVIALSGRMMPETAELKTDWMGVARIKFFIAHGNSDNVIKIADGEKARDFLKAKKVTDLSYTAYEIPHSLNGKEVSDIKAWLVKAISPKAQPAKK